MGLKRATVSDSSTCSTAKVLSDDKEGDCSENTYQLHLGVNDVPGWTSLLLYGAQQSLLCISGLLVVPFLMSEVACAGNSTISLRVQLISATFLTSGIATLLQTTFGLRLSILHGPSYAFLPSLLAYSTISGNECLYGKEDVVPEEKWMDRVVTIQGSLFCACLLMIIAGATGIVGLIGKYVGPVTIASLMLMLVLGTVPTLVDKISLHWISVVEFFILLAFAVYLEDVHVSIPYFSFAKRKLVLAKKRVFGQFPYLLGILLAWFICFILTVTDLEPENGEARTDKNITINVLHSSPWIHVPLPFQYGFPKVNISMVFGFLASCVACMMETLGDYGVCAKVSHQRAPPVSTINRGIMIEGIGSCLAALMGVGTGVTTYAENIALMHITRVASRATMQVTGCILIVVGLFTKVAAVLASIPDAVVGGLLAMGMAMIAGVGISNLRTVDLQITRNLSVIGIALLSGMVVPDYFQKHPMDTDNATFDRIINMLLSIRMLIAGVVALVLDNTVSGANRRQRGFLDKEHADDSFPTEVNGYAFPERVNRFLLDHKWISRAPFMPSVRMLRENLSLSSDNSSL